MSHSNHSLSTLWDRFQIYALTTVYTYQPDLGGRCAPILELEYLEFGLSLMKSARLSSRADEGDLLKMACVIVDLYLCLIYWKSFACMQTVSVSSENGLQIIYLQIYYIRSIFLSPTLRRILLHTCLFFKHDKPYAVVIFVR